MSPRDSTKRGVMVPKAKNDVYTALLAISLGAILIAIICLLLEMRSYNWDFRAQDARASVTISQPYQVAAVDAPATTG